MRLLFRCQISSSCRRQEVMKQPSAAVENFKRRKVMKRPAAAVKKRPASAAKRRGRETPGKCKRLQDLTREDLIFIVGAGKGVRSSRPGYYFRHRGFNQFDRVESKIPSDVQERRLPSDRWLSRYIFCNQTLLRGIPALTQPAMGRAYQILGYDFPFVCWVSDGKVSVFQPPSIFELPGDSDGLPDVALHWDEICSLCTEEVVSFANPVQTFADGLLQDYENSKDVEVTFEWIDHLQQPYNDNVLGSVLVALGKSCIAMSLDIQEAGEELHLRGTLLSGTEVYSQTVPADIQVGAFTARWQEHNFQEGIRVFDVQGDRVSHKAGLKQYSQLVLKWPEHKYAYIGKRIYTFTVGTKVVDYLDDTAPFGIGFPYPIALTKSTVLFMRDGTEVSKARLLASFKGQMPRNTRYLWRNAYKYFGPHKAIRRDEETDAPLRNVEVIRGDYAGQHTHFGRIHEDAKDTRIFGSKGRFPLSFNPNEGCCETIEFEYVCSRPWVGRLSDHNICEHF